MNERRNGVRHSAESSLKVLFDDVAALLKREICEIEEFAAGAQESAHGGEVGGDEAAVRLALSGASGALVGSVGDEAVAGSRGSAWSPGWLLFSLDVWGAWAYAGVSDGLA